VSESWEDRQRELLPGLEESIRILTRLHAHSGGVYTEFDSGWKAGVESATNQLRMHANQIRNMEEAE
jgi:hypothetical protein